MAERLKSIGDFLRAMLAAIATFGMVNFVALTMLVGMMGTIAIVGFAIYKFVPIGLSIQNSVSTYVARQDYTNRQQTDILKSLKEGQGIATEHMNMQHGDLMTAIRERAFEPPHITRPPMNADGYDAEDRSELWKQNKRVLKRLDEMDKRLKRQEKKQGVK